MGVLQAIGKGFSEAAKFLKVIILFFIFNFVVGLFMLPFSGPQNANNPTAMAAAVGISLVSILIFIFIQGGALGLIKEYLKTNSVNFSNFMANSKKYYLNILILFLCIIIIALLVIVVVALIAAAVLAVANNAFSRAIIAVLVTVVAAGSAVILLFPIYSLIADDNGPVAAIKKGIQFSLGKFWNSLGLLLLLFLISFGIAFIIGIITALLTTVLPLAVGNVVSLLVNSALQAYLSMIMMVALMAFYLSLSSSTGEAQGPSI